jgi:hypothetical protein
MRASQRDLSTVSMERCILWVDLPVDMFVLKKKDLGESWWEVVCFLGGKLFVGSSYGGNEAVFIRFSRVRVDRKKNPLTLSMVLFVICTSIQLRIVRLCISLAPLGLTILQKSVDLHIAFVCAELHSVVWTNDLCTAFGCGKPHSVAWKNDLGIRKPHLRGGSSIQWHGLIFCVDEWYGHSHIAFVRGKLDSAAWTNDLGICTSHMCALSSIPWRGRMIWLFAHPICVRGAPFRGVDE